MAGFLYFIPNLNALSSEQHLGELGLGYVLEQFGRKSVGRITGGPEGQNGLLLSDPQRVDPGRSGYYPQRQTWSKHHGKGYWVGLEKGIPLGPAELARRELLDGELLTLGDDRRWQIPRARQWSASDDPRVMAQFDTCLEQSLEQNDAGQMVPGQVLPRYAQLWAIATAYFHHLVEISNDEEELVLRGEQKTLNLTSAAVLAARVLQHNYAVGLVECQMLGLLTTSNWRLILNATIDWRSYEELREKKMQQLRDSLSSSAGLEDTPPSTDPPSPTSSPLPGDSTTSPTP